MYWARQVVFLTKPGGRVDWLLLQEGLGALVCSVPGPKKRKDTKMVINIVSLLVILILSGLAYWVNEQLNTIPVLKTVVRVIIVVVAVLLVLQSMALMNTNTAIIVK